MRRRTTVKPEPTTGILDEKKPKERPSNAIVKRDHGDGYSPLNDGSRLKKRNERIRYLGDQIQLVLMRQLMWALVDHVSAKSDYNTDFDALRALEENREDYDRAYKKFISEHLTDARYREKSLANPLYAAYDKIRYKEISGLRRLFRVVYNVFSFGGGVPKVWYTITQSSYTAALTVSVSWLVQSQTEAEKFVNGRETYIQLQSFLHNLFQMALLVMAMLALVNAINYAFGVAWKSSTRLIREERFDFLLKSAYSNNAYTEDYMLEYNTDIDPDVGFIYFTLREEKYGEEETGGPSFLSRFRQLLALKVDKDLIWDRVVVPQLSIKVPQNGIKT